MRSRTLSLGVLFLFGGACSQIIGLSDYEKTDDNGQTGGKSGGGAGAGSGGRATGGRASDAGSSGDAGAGGTVVHTGGTSGTGGGSEAGAGPGGVGGEAGAAGSDTGGSPTGGTTGQGGTGKGGATTGGAVGKGGSGGTVSTGGTLATGGKASTGGAIATGGTLATGGKAGTGGAIATGGTLATGGKAGTGGAIATGGTAGKGGSGGTGGACTTVEMLTGKNPNFDDFAGVGNTGPDPSPWVNVTSNTDAVVNDIDHLPVSPQSGNNAAWFGGLGGTFEFSDGGFGEIYELDLNLTMPANVTSATLSCYFRSQTNETSATIGASRDLLIAWLWDETLSESAYTFHSWGPATTSAWQLFSYSATGSAAAALSSRPLILMFYSEVDELRASDFFIDTCSFKVTTCN
ncbi:MAG TPA: hypothetical protein VG937_26730 [Polyangiaceae bacterium]|nr:hypothetical protein [Polyangiaceae bacterium]